MRLLLVLPWQPRPAEVAPGVVEACRGLKAGNWSDANLETVRRHFDETEGRRAWTGNQPGRPPGLDPLTYGKARSGGAAAMLDLIEKIAKEGL